MKLKELNDRGLFNDVYDSIFDWEGVYWEYGTDTNDNMNVVLAKISNQLEVIKITQNSITCHFTKWIKNHWKLLVEYTEEFWLKHYWLPGKYDEDLTYVVLRDIITPLASGDLCEQEYSWLRKRLGK